jgi:DNA polymerase-3 subunit epsilon
MIPGPDAARGVTVGRRDTLLTDRAADYLEGGPADVCALISHVCSLPGAPRAVAEHIATTLFAGHRRFARAPDGRWHLRTEAAPAADAGPPSRLRALPYAVVDVETTGGQAYGGDRVTEIAVVEVKDGAAATVFETLINPERSIPSLVSAITNITWEMVKDAPRFSEVCAQLVAVLEGRVFVAHNASFDWRFLSMEVERAIGRPLEGRRLCTVRLARRLLPQLHSRSLDSVTAHYGVDITRRHRAGGDAVATARVLLRLLDDAQDRGYGTWDTLDRFLARHPRGRRSRRRSALPRSARGDWGA